MTGLLGAVALLTRVPVPGRDRASAGELAAAVPWFPVVGAALGAAGAAAYGAGRLALPATVAASLAVGAQLLATGAFHEDGLADVADAAGGWSPDQRRRILDDPRHGTYGVAALTLALVTRVAALSALDGPAGLAALVAAGAAGRGAAVGLLALGRPGPGRGAATAHGEALRPAGAAAGLAGAAVLATLALGPWALPALGLAAAAAAGLGRWAVRALGGVNGDVLGAAAAVTEVAVVVLAAGAGPGVAWWR